MKKNIKKFLAMGLVSVMAAGLFGCSLNEETPQKDETSIEISETDIEKMHTPIDALICSIWERGYSFDPSSEEFLWSSLMYILRENAYSTENSAEATINVSRSILKEYASSLIHGLESIPENIPDVFSQQITYSKDEDSYIISPIYREETLTKINDFTKNPDGTITVSASLYTSDTDELLGTWEVFLDINPSYSEENEHSSKLSVKDVALIEVFQTQNVFTKTATFLGLSDTHTIEVMYTNGEIATFQFYEDEVAGKLSGFFEGEVFTFVYNQDRETGLSEIIEIY